MEAIELLPLRLPDTLEDFQLVTIMAKEDADPRENTTAFRISSTLLSVASRNQRNDFTIQGETDSSNSELEFDILHL